MISREPRLSFRPLHDEKINTTACDLLQTDELRAMARVALRQFYEEEAALVLAGEKPAWSAALLATETRASGV